MVLPMAREKFQTLTEQMFYVLLFLRDECCGADIMARIANITHGRVTVGPGTLYNLLESFQETGWIVETKTEGPQAELSHYRCRRAGIGRRVPAAASAV